jgi:hypothetical protein
MQRRRAEIEAYYGDLTIANGRFDGPKRRRWRAEWALAPQPLQVH